MKSTPSILLGLLVLMAIATFVICMIEAVPNETGANHPQYIETSADGVATGTIKVAPSGADRHSSAILWSAGVYGASGMAFCVVFMAIGMNFRSGEGIGRLLLCVLAGIYAAVLACVVVVYGQSMDLPNQTYFLGFPISMAVTMYVLALVCPALLVTLYMIGFNRLICDPKDICRFEELVRARRAEQKD